MSRQHPKKPLSLSYRVFQFAKDIEDCQDNYFPEKSYALKRITSPIYFGLTDGVSQGYNSRSWTEVLLSSFQKYGFDLWNYVPRIAKVWMEEQKERITTEIQGEFIRSLHLKRLNEVGGASTITLLKISPSGHFSVEGVGDSCLLLIRNNRLILQTPEIRDFGNLPEQVSSCEPYFNQKAVQKVSGNLRKGDTLLIMSDALCEWTMQDTQRIEILKRSSREELLELVQFSQETNEMNVDDVTYMELCIW